MHLLYQTLSIMTSNKSSMNKGLFSMIDVRKPHEKQRSVTEEGWSAEKREECMLQEEC